MNVPFQKFTMQCFHSERFIVGCRVNVDDSINRVRSGSKDLDEILVQTTIYCDLSKISDKNVLNVNVRNYIVTEPAEFTNGIEWSTKRGKQILYGIRNICIVVISK